MNKRLIKIFLSILIIIFAINCSTNTAMNSYGVSGPAVMIDNENIESDITIEGRIRGEGSKTYLLGILPLGDTHRVEGVWRDGNPLLAVFDRNHAKMEATYNALVSNGADMIIEPRYQIETKRTLLWTTVRAQVYGFKGTINSYKQYKQDKPTYLEENFGYPPSEGTIKVEVKDD